MLKQLCITLLSLSTLSFATTYSDGEDGTIGKWKVYDNKPAGATISNVMDTIKKSNVIELKGDHRRNGYILNAKKWNNKTEKHLTWSMNFSEKFKITVYVKTLSGQRTFIYTHENNDKGFYKNKYIKIGLGSKSMNGTWQNFSRDLEADLKKYEPSNTLVKVRGFKVQGSGRIDDVRLENNLPTNKVSKISKNTISKPLKDALSYMYDEERLAKELYLSINQTQPLKQLYNIATQSESKHIDAVNELAKEYGIPTLPQITGVYEHDEIQALYDKLYAKGISSKKDALEVGCMVEVVDINDLNKYVKEAESSNQKDVLDAFNFLRRGSYNHYWAFDNGLKALGITEGCCSLGDTYCHTEYPKKEHGHGNGKGNNQNDNHYGQNKTHEQGEYGERRGHRRGMGRGEGRGRGQAWI